MRRAGTKLIASVTVGTGRRNAFRYFNDGDWFNDDADDDADEPNEFGGYNFVVDLTTDERVARERQSAGKP